MATLFPANFPEWLLSQRQQQIYIYLRNSKLHIFLAMTVVLKGTNFYVSLLGEGFCEKWKHTELALNFIQKQ